MDLEPEPSSWSLGADHCADDNEEAPLHFLCPISLEVMRDPVILCTGITYDRSSINTWLHTTVHNTCPVTNQTLANKDLLPNLVLGRLIQKWNCSRPRPSQHKAGCSCAPMRSPGLLHELLHQQLSSPSIPTLRAVQRLIKSDYTLSRLSPTQVTDLITMLARLLQSTEDAATCETSLELLEMLLLSSSPPEGYINRDAATSYDYHKLIPTITATILGVSLRATEYSVRILCRLCVDEKCCREAVERGVVAKVLMVLQLAQASTASASKKKASALLRLLCKKGCRVPRIYKQPAASRQPLQGIFFKNR